ncbi:MAG: DUF1016 N-terminal domain-containing protein [Defluviitaleaceae bacterium]|nr:DUF1016 N-terminal domain-containing protein [Defluviitaleaceae bacterium]
MAKTDDKNKTELVSGENINSLIDKNGGQILFQKISDLIEQSRRTMYTQVNNVTVLLFWEIGRYINQDILENKRADYGKKIVSTLSTQLTEKYGRSFGVRNLRRMMQLAEQFSDFEIVSKASTQFSWSHFIEILPLKTMEAKLYYIDECVRGLVGVMQLREMIS